MKQKDIALILVMVFISGVLSFVISGQIFGSPKNREQKAEVVESITAEFPPPPAKYFNGRSINPTQLITIGGGTNPNPFDKKD
ncbi:MAG TPA: hypothetical protein VFB59_05500 [Candidatus Saccharimonadales bacterium]|nr:hypothetical protein [Candidatus Saccharimonadales bacterium]